MTHLEGMGKSTANMEIDVLISTAGVGSRLHKISPDINKSLLPYSNKPIIYHIIEKIPRDLRIGILLGYKSQQVKDFLTLAYPERKFLYIDVDDWTSSKSGTKYSLMFARKSLSEAFWYFPCDGIYENTDFLFEVFKEDVFVVSKIDKDKAFHYLTFKIRKQRIIEQFFKSTVVNGDYAFTGVMKINNKEDFFSRLEASESSEFISVILENSLIYVTDKWKDLGNFEMYQDAISKTDEFDFSKAGEYTYQLSNKIIKWWADPKIASLKLEKPSIKPEVFPKNVQSKNQFLSYDKSLGTPFYEQVNKDNFKTLLLWLKEQLWLPSEIDIRENLKDFYKNKTLTRINLLGNKKLVQSYNPKVINGIEVQSWQFYYERINWDFLTQNAKSSFIHGDLQFDNIIYEKSTNKFTLIDWRYDFSGLMSIGDLYYDFAKMLGGIHMNYQEIKKGKFDFSLKNNTVEIKVPSLDESKDLILILEDHAKDLGLDVNKINALVPLIFWNMAPLHKEPFASICWCLGLMNYEILDK